ncbi:MAG: HAD family hydrolase [Deltaproteobacteria bacterium]|nr:MAG: HAD family hydrolase [Deltaproteobacteria bacterium]
MVRVVIFDCDGVMFDSKEANRAYYNEILRRMGQREMDPQELEFVHASTAQEALRFLFKRRGVDLQEGLSKAKEVDYRPFIGLMKPEPHLRELLEAIPPDVKKAISTNRTTTIGPLLDHFGLRDHFDLVISARDVSRPKPHPDSLLRILEHFSLMPHQALFIGDTERDERASRLAGIPFVAYKNPALRADYHIDDLLEILDIIRNKRP